MAEKNVAEPGTPQPGTDQVAPEVAYRNALASPMVPKIYANHFGTVIQANDLALFFGQTGMATLVLTLSYSTAKTLGAKLQEAVATYEKKVGISFPSSETIELRLRES